MSTAGQKEVLGLIELAVGELTYAEGGAWLVQMGIETMVAGGLQELANLLAPSPVPAAQNGIVRSSVANQQRIYGQVKTGGVIAFSDSYGTNNENLCVAITHSLTRTNGSVGMPVQKVGDVFVGNVQIPDAYINAVTGAIAAGPGGSAWNSLVGNLFVFRYDGSQTAVDTTLNANFSYWPITAIGHGTVYTVFKMFNSPDQATFQAAYPQGIPSMLGAIVSGQKVYDPRLDSTNGGSGSQRLATPSTWTFSSNPALIAADYLSTPKGDGGGGFATSQIDWVSVAAAASICDTNVTLPNYAATWNGTAWSSTVTQAQYTCNVALDLGVNCDQNLRIILDCMAGVCVVAGGMFHLYAGAATSSSGTFDETFLAGDISFTNETARQSRWNAVKSTYGQDPQCEYQQQQGATVYNSSYETADGGVRLLKSITLPGVNNQFAAQYLQIIESQRSRNKRILVAKCSTKMLHYQAYDIVSVTIAELGLSSSPFRILNYTLNADLSIDVTMQEEAAGTYTVALNGQYTSFTPSSFITGAANPGTLPPPPSSLTVSALPQGVLLSWAPPSPNLYRYEMVARAPDVAGSPGTYATIAKMVGDSYLDKSAIAGTKYWYKVQSINFWLVPSAYCTQQTVTAITNTVGGSDPGAVALSSVTGAQRNLVPDSDIKYGLVYWSLINSAGGTWFINDNGDHINNGAEFVGNGTSGGSAYARTAAFAVHAGDVYTVSAVVIAMANIASGTVNINIVKSDLSAFVTAMSCTSATANGRISGQVTIPAGWTSAFMDMSLNNATVTNGGGIIMQQPQVEAGSVLTAYRSTDDQNGYSLVTGSGPTTIPSSSFTYSSTTSQIVWSWSSMAWFNADGTSTSVSNSSMTTTGLTASINYYSYPYYDLVKGGNVAWVGGGSGSNGNEHTAKTASLASAQNLAYRVPLSSGGMLGATTASGSGSGAGGGNKCLHPETRLNVRMLFDHGLDAEECEITAKDLRDGMHLRTPEGWQPVSKIGRKPRSDWIKASFNTGETVLCTPSHLFILPDLKGGIAARDMKLSTLLAAEGALAVVQMLEAVEEEADCVQFTVPCHHFYAREGGVLQHNTTLKQ